MIRFPFSYHCSLVYFIFYFSFSFSFGWLGARPDFLLLIFSFFFFLSSVCPRLFVFHFSLFTYHFSLFFGPPAAKRETKEKNEYKVVVFLLDLGESVEKPFFPYQTRRLRSVPLGTTDRKPREKTLTKCGKPLFGVLSAGQSAADRGRWRDKIRGKSSCLVPKNKSALQGCGKPAPGRDFFDRFVKARPFSESLRKTAFDKSAHRAPGGALYLSPEILRNTGLFRRGFVFRLTERKGQGKNLWGKSVPFPHAFPQRCGKVLKSC